MELRATKTTSLSFAEVDGSQEEELGFSRYIYWTDESIEYAIEDWQAN